MPSMSTATRASKARKGATTGTRGALADWLQSYAERARCDVSEHDVLTSDRIWSEPGPLVWKAHRLADTPNFYPVYRCGDFYSHSPLALLLRKGTLSIDRDVAHEVDSARFVYLSGTRTLDTDIRRVGAPPVWERRIHRTDEYVERLAAAMQQDVTELEERNPGSTNIVLCGGKDSLNLLLLRWRNPTKVASAQPNYPLVRRFVEENRLGFEVVCLEDDHDREMLDREILLNFCRADLTHWRWGAHLARLASEHNEGVVFWKGQLADVFTAPKWKTYMHPMGARGEIYLKLFKRAEAMLPMGVATLLGRPRQARLMQALWTRGAMMQGTHMGFIRELTGSLALSAYHGRRVAEVVHQADIAAVAQCDIRGHIGRLLAGRDVRYPEANPAPPPSEIRRGLHTSSAFLSTLSEAGFSC